MENRKKTIVLIIITIAVFLVVILGATFAYFATERNIGSAINANVGTAGKTYQFTAASNDNIEMNIVFNEMSQANVDNTFLKSANATIDVSLASPTNDTLTTCTYDIVWVWDNEDMYTIPDVEFPYTHIDSKVYNYEFSIKVDEEAETDLSQLPLTDKKVTLQSGFTIESNSVEAMTKTHNVSAYIYNLPVEQTNLFNKNFKAHITIDNLNCNMKIQKGPEEGTLAYHVIKTVYESDANQANIAANKAGLYFHDKKGTLTNGAADDTYRYSGSDGDVNNYVCFSGDNCTNVDNLYRIISVDSHTNQIKVIKAQRIASKMIWNSKTGYTAKAGEEGLTAGTTYKNLWAYKKDDGTYYTSSLNDYLNGTYLTSLNNKANKIVETSWKVGGYFYAQKNSSTPKQIYDIEKADSVTYPAKIGLMYVSEYGFAALPTYWTNTFYNFSISQGKNWMLTGTDFWPWTISRSSSDDHDAFCVNSDNGDMNSGNVTGANGVRPSFTLSSDVKITNSASTGVGSKTNPMIII